MTIVEWINQILIHKTPWENFDDSEHKTFSPFIVNRWLSMDSDYVVIAQERIKAHEPEIKQHDFF